jgi:hypothetical protein
MGIAAKHDHARQVAQVGKTGGNHALASWLGASLAFCVTCLGGGALFDGDCVGAGPKICG